MRRTSPTRTPTSTTAITCNSHGRPLHAIGFQSPPMGVSTNLDTSPTTTPHLRSAKKTVSELSARFSNRFQNRRPADSDTETSDDEGEQQGVRGHRRISGGAKVSPLNSPDEVASHRQKEKELWIRRAHLLSKFLESRPRYADLLSKNILPSRTGLMRAELRTTIEATLERRLSLRPTAGELEQKNILHCAFCFVFCY